MSDTPELWRVVLRLMRSAYPGGTPRMLRLKAGLLLQCHRHRRMLARWHGSSAPPALREALDQRPALAALVHWPYLNTRWPAARRAETVEMHYRMLHTGCAELRFPVGATVTVAALDDLSPGLALVLDKPDWFRQEGEVVLNLCVRTERLYSLAFTLGRIGAERVAYVGAVQGRHLPHALDTYRALTHAAHGLRPRDLLLAAFQVLCEAWRIDAMLGISDAACCRRSDWFGDHAEHVRFSYDTMWREHGGVPRPDGFFLLDACWAPRPIESIPSRKRAQYRRRYAMLEALRRQIAARRGEPSEAHPVPEVSRHLAVA